MVRVRCMLGFILNPSLWVSLIYLILGRPDVWFLWFRSLCREYIGNIESIISFNIKHFWKFVRNKRKTKSIPNQMFYNSALCCKWDCQLAVLNIPVLQLSMVATSLHLMCLSNTFGLSLSMGIVLSIRRLSYVCPIFKFDDNLLVANYELFSV